MFNYEIGFESPWYLLLLALVPVVWWFSFRGLAALGYRHSASAWDLCPGCRFPP